MYAYMYIYMYAYMYIHCGLDMDLSSLFVSMIFMFKSIKSLNYPY